MVMTQGINELGVASSSCYVQWCRTSLDEIGGVVMMSSLHVTQGSRDFESEQKLHF